MSINKWMDEQIVVYPDKEVLLSSNSNELLIHSTTWINLKIMMLSKRNQTPPKYYIG